MNRWVCDELWSDGWFSGGRQESTAWQQSLEPPLMDNLYSGTCLSGRSSSSSVALFPQSAAKSDVTWEEGRMEEKGQGVVLYHREACFYTPTHVHSHMLASQSAEGYGLLISRWSECCPNHTSNLAGDVWIRSDLGKKPRNWLNPQSVIDRDQAKRRTVWGTFWKRGLDISPSVWACDILSWNTHFLLALVVFTVEVSIKWRARKETGPGFCRQWDRVSCTEISTFAQNVLYYFSLFSAYIHLWSKLCRNRFFFSVPALSLSLLLFLLLCQRSDSADFLQQLLVLVFGSMMILVFLCLEMYGGWPLPLCRAALSFCTSPPHTLQPITHVAPLFY